MIRRSSRLSHVLSSKKGGDGKGNKILTTMYDFKRERGQLFNFHQNRLLYVPGFSKRHFISCILCIAPSDEM